METTTEQIDALTEIINIGTGRAAAALSEITGSWIDLNVPSVIGCQPDSLHEHVTNLEGDSLTLISQGFSGGLSGKASLTFPSKSALHLAHFVGEVEEEADEFDFDLEGILEEIGNIVLNSVLGSISNIFECGLDYELPEFVTNTELNSFIQSNCQAEPNHEMTILVANTQFCIASRDITGSLMIVFKVECLKRLLTKVLED